MAGIYIHIPFCKQACSYCNFYFTTSIQLVAPTVDAIIKEIELKKTYLPTSAIETIYFGGGTPGFIDVHFIENILAAIHKHYTVLPLAEITLECNPDDMQVQKLQAYKAMGINRLSIGTQSIFEADLKYMNRAHNAEQALQTIALAKQVGISNVNTDLIFGYPLLSNNKWEETLNMAATLQLPHLSCYALTVEEKTALAYAIQKQKAPPINATQAAEQFEYLMQWAANNNYVHYEISNYALPNKQAIHNTNYWLGKPYIGIGPSAHSYNGTTRQWNIANNANYIKGITNNQNYYEQEILTTTQKINEYIMTRLRIIQGVELAYIQANTTPQQWQAFNASIAKQEKFIINNNGFVLLNNTGKMYADYVASALFVE